MPIGASLLYPSCVRKYSTHTTMATPLVTVTNGLFAGRTSISATLAIKLIQAGSAELDVHEGEKPEEVRRIRMTHKAYEDVTTQKPEKRRRIYRSSDAGPALSTVQREELYWGAREDNPDITFVKRVLKKTHNGRFKSWTESDKFPRHRFNPDRIPPAIFQNYSAVR